MLTQFTPKWITTGRVGSVEIPATVTSSLTETRFTSRPLPQYHDTAIYHSNSHLGIRTSSLSVYVILYVLLCDTNFKPV